MLLSKAEYPLDDLLVQVDLHDDTVRIPEDLVPLSIQNLHQRGHVRALGDGGRHVSGTVEHRQPGSQPIRGLADIAGVNPVIAQLLQHVLAVAAFVHQTDQGGGKLAVGNILRHISPHAAMDPLDPAGIFPGGKQGRLRIALDIHEDHADDHNSHILCLLK